MKTALLDSLMNEVDRIEAEHRKVSAEKIRAERKARCERVADMTVRELLTANATPGDDLFETIMVNPVVPGLFNRCK